MTDRNYPASGAAVLDPIGLDRHHQPLLLIDSDIEDVHAGNIEHRIGPGAPAHTRATHTVGHRRGLRREAWSLLILKAPTPSTHDQHAQLARPAPMPICEEPVNQILASSGRQLPDRDSRASPDLAADRTLVHGAAREFIHNDVFEAVERCEPGFEPPICSIPSKPVLVDARPAAGAESRGPRA
jgi:hypothetical protein